MKTIHPFLALLIVMMIAALQGHAQGVAYVWTGGEPGFSATIVLDSASSPPGGGSVSDIISMTGSIPLPNGSEYEFGYAPLLPWEGNMYSVISVSEPFVWNAQEITAMSIWYAPYGTAFAVWESSPHLFGGENANGWGEGVNPPQYIFDTSGSWVAAASVPEPGAEWLLLFGAGALGFRYLASLACRAVRWACKADCALL